jgi:glutathione S-transferase
MAEIKFYYAPGACSLAPHILLHEISAKFEAIPNTITATTVKLTSGFQAINPKLRIPVLCIDGETITETPAVLTAICTLLAQPNNHFLGKTPLETVRVYEWLNWISGTLHGHAFGGVLRPARLTDDEVAFAGIREKGMKNVREAFEVIEGKLTAVFAVGEEFSVVDAYLFVFWRWGNEMGFRMREQFPNYTGLVEELVKRDAVKAALEAEGIKYTA